MSLLSDTEDTTRETQSALDFMYIVIDSCNVIYTRSIAVKDFAGLAEDETASVDLVRFGCDQVGIEVPASFSLLSSLTVDEETRIDPVECLRVRGGLLFRNQGIAISVGDGKRLVEATGTDVTIRYMTGVEMAEGFWDFAAKVPGMMYA